MQKIAQILDSKLKIKLINTQIKDPSIVNEGCGAEFVHKEGKEPTEVTSSMPDKAASFDGDADRLIYFMRGKDSSRTPIIIDGDKQFSFLMMYVKKQLESLGISDLSHVLVNTAYANSRANEYLAKNKVNVVCVPTGVKNAEPVVHQYTIGANDEPNGHGTICIKWDKLESALAGKEN